MVVAGLAKSLIKISPSSVQDFIFAYIHIMQIQSPARTWGGGGGGPLFSCTDLLRQGRYTFQQHKVEASHHWNLPSC